MKKIMRRVLAFALVLVSVCTAMMPLANAAAVNDLPIVYVIGRGTRIYDKNGKQVYPTSGIEQAIKDSKRNLIASWAKSLISGNWDDLSDAIYDLVENEYKDFILDNNGEASNGTHVEPNAAPKAKKSNYTLTDYQFSYDSRLDPYTNADLLNTYINKVISVTGKSKVQLIGRCLGSTVISAYLTKYGCSKVDTAIFYAASNQGLIPLSEFFTGDVVFDVDAIQRYGDTYLKNSPSDGSDGFTRGLLTLLYNLSKNFLIMAWGVDSVEKAYRDIARTLYPRIVLAVYGTCPGFWTMVRDDHYEKAKQVVFAGNEAKYAKLISKIDKYHYNVLQKFPENLQKWKKQGMKVAVIAKYNTQLAPLFENCMMQADDLVELESASYGATCGNIGSYLPDDYIKKLERENNTKYLSPDCMVDASTCLFPDYTWFIKDLPHDNFPTAVNELIISIFQSKTQYTIDSNEKYPQYLQYESDSLLLTPVTVEGLPTEKPYSLIRKIANALNTIFVLLKLLFNVM